MDARRTLIYLFRHGEITPVEPRRFVGHMDVPLSPLGERQCAAQAERLRGVKLAAVITSDLARARRSGEIIAAPHGLRPDVVPALREMDMGRWDGLTAAEIAERDPRAFSDWMARIGNFAFPGGESLGDVLARAWPAFEAMAVAYAGERIAVVAHGGTNRALLCRALDLPLGCILAFGQDYAALTLLERAEGRWRLRRLNEFPVL
ncbi:MAG: hypothetical protein AUH29_06565 [Candidatus Rokubacteria bacterium 13_1_40CM_69_27]|nr:MAG: hypothetical protein AUH29_06565 [Candidatus Rokubacteria bacterium 13_1_40CM_69_27]OLC39834.1 MAG: hypothetical protein AUH81_00370 [Candidatus Rokubacteria bacterium 13_1_40CM_4_69_5]